MEKKALDGEVISQEAVTLEGISNLHSEEAETQIKELCKR